jgi:hypothetical protein
MNKIITSAAAVILLTPGLAYEASRPPSAAQEGSKAPLMVSFTDLKWTELAERKGMQFALISGEPQNGSLHSDAEGSRWH